MLTAAERAVLDVLAEGFTTSSVIRLAADLYGRGDEPDERFMFGDPIGFVTWLLEGLNAQGFVTYRVKGDEPYAFHGLPYHIRLTPQGWTAMGFPRLVIEVGRSGGMREVMVSDRTDYRTHHIYAEGGPISRHWRWQCSMRKGVTRLR